MTVARSNPLAPGVYWLDVFRPVLGRPGPIAPDGQPVFLGWVQDSPGVNVLRTEHDDRPSPIRVKGGQVVRTWYSFEVEPNAEPAPFPFKRLGFPTIVKLGSAPGGVTNKDRATTSADTAQNKPTTASDVLSNLLAPLDPRNDMRPLILIGLGLWVYSKLSRRR